MKPTDLEVERRISAALRAMADAVAAADRAEQEALPVPEPSVVYDVQPLHAPLPHRRRGQLAAAIGGVAAACAALVVALVVVLGGRGAPHEPAGGTPSTKPTCVPTFSIAQGKAGLHPCNSASAVGTASSTQSSENSSSSPASGSSASTP